MLQVYKHQLAETDCQGRHVLAVACQCPVANRSCDVLTKIQLVLREDPGASQHVDPQLGQHPLLTAVSAGILWNDGVESLIQAFPVALTYRDPTTKLFPFALAALPKADQASTDARLEIDTIFNTLRADPSVLRLCGYS